MEMSFNAQSGPLPLIESLLSGFHISWESENLKSSQKFQQNKSLL